MENTRLAKKLVLEVESEVNGRRGVKWNKLDDEVLTELRGALTERLLAVIEKTSTACGCEGSCPVCRIGEVEHHLCNVCQTWFCNECHGVARVGRSSGGIGLCQCNVAI